MSKQDLSIPALDSRVVKMLLDKFGFCKGVSERKDAEAAKAAADMAEAEADYKDYFTRLAAERSITELEDYQINFVTLQFEVKPPPPEPPKPVRPPDADLPPAPGPDDTKLEVPSK